MEFGKETQQLFENKDIQRLAKLQEKCSKKLLSARQSVKC